MEEAKRAVIEAGLASLFGQSLNNRRSDGVT